MEMNALLGFLLSTLAFPLLTKKKKKSLIQPKMEISKACLGNGSK